MDRTLDPAVFARAMELSLTSLRAHEGEINSLNVYPVPDGDTGTNLRLTMEAVVRDLPRDAQPGALAAAVSRSALLGARGNSGVILSQILRGLTEGLGWPERSDVAGALAVASREADRAVARPADGTILSVLRDAAGAAARAADGGGSAADVLEAALEEARASLARTPDQLPELGEAGVVDAGGRGLVLMLDSLRSAVTGGALSEDAGQLGPVGRPVRADPPAKGPRYRYEVQFLLQGADEHGAGSLRRSLGSLGDSVVLVGGGGLYKVHVHTNEPDAALTAGREAGEPRDVSVTDLAEQVQGCLAGQARGVQVAEQLTGLVAVVEGEGLARIFRSLGAVVVEGGPGNNPAVSELLAAIEAAAGRGVVVLPNHPNVVPAAERAAEAATRPAIVVGARSVVAGIAAATAFTLTDGLEDNERAMAKAVEGIRSGEVVRAERDARTPSGAVGAGDWLGMVEGDAVSVGRSLVQTALAVGSAVALHGAEILTVVVGAGVATPDGDTVVDALRSAHPSLEVEAVRGDQPRTAFLIGAE